MGKKKRVKLCQITPGPNLKVGDSVKLPGKRRMMVIAVTGKGQSLPLPGRRPRPA